MSEEWRDQVQARLYALVAGTDDITGQLAAVLHDAVHTMINEKLIAPHREPSEADALWAELNPQQNDQILGAVLIAKIFDFDQGSTVVSMAATDDVDWVLQYGLLTAALNVMNQQQIAPRDE